MKEGVLGHFEIAKGSFGIVCRCKGNRPSESIVAIVAVNRCPIESFKIGLLECTVKSSCIQLAVSHDDDRSDTFALDPKARAYTVGLKLSEKR